MTDDVGVLAKFFGPRKAGEIVAERERAAAGAARRHTLKAEYDKKGSEYEAAAARDVTDAARQLAIADRLAREAQLAVRLAAQASTEAELHRSSLRQRRKEIATELLASADRQLVALHRACLHQNVREPRPVLREAIVQLEDLALEVELAPAALDRIEQQLRAAGVMPTMEDR